MAEKYPKTIGACVDMLYQRRQERLELSRRVDDMKAAESALEDHILQTFGKSDISGAKGKACTAAIKHTTVVQVTDWDSFLEYVRKTKSWDMLRKQPSATAVQERWSLDKQVPGVEPFVKISLSLSKI